MRRSHRVVLHDSFYLREDDGVRDGVWDEAREKAVEDRRSLAPGVFAPRILSCAQLGRFLADG